MRCRASKDKVPKDLIVKHSWVVSDKDGNACFCKLYKEHYTSNASHGLPCGSDGTFLLKPFNKWSKATGQSPKNNKLLKHQESQYHRMPVAQAKKSASISQNV